MSEGSRLKILFLTLLTIQAATASLSTRYSRGVLDESYNKVTVVFTTEVIKFLFALYMIKNEHDEESGKMGGPRVDAFVPMVQSVLMSGYELAVPALIYFVQNQLAFMALSELSAGTFSLVNQLKVFTTCLFAYLILGQVLSARKWRALLLLVMGVALIQVNPSLTPKDEEDREGSFWGLVAALAQVCLSGFSGIYFEMVLKRKGKKAKIWEKNLQLAFYSIMIGVFNILYVWKDLQAGGGFFGGWSLLTMFIAVNSACGGFLVAFSVKHTNTIIKGFAGSGAIVLSSILGYYFFGDHLDSIFAIGAGCVILSIFNYADPDPPANPGVGSGMSK